MTAAAVKYILVVVSCIYRDVPFKASQRKNDYVAQRIGSSLRVRVRVRVQYRSRADNKVSTVVVGISQFSLW